MSLDSEKPPRESYLIIGCASKNLLQSQNAIAKIEGLQLSGLAKAAPRPRLLLATMRWGGLKPWRPTVHCLFAANLPTEWLVEIVEQTL
jgi:hypothetical protein